MELDPADPIDAIALAWAAERPGTPVDSIGIVTRLWQAAKLLGEDRRRTLARAGADTAVLDLLSVLRRSGPPYRLSTRELADATLVSAGAISQRVARAERDGLVTRVTRADGSRRVDVGLTAAGHALVERLVDGVLGREADLVSCLDADQQRELVGLLRVLLDGLQRELGERRPSQVGDPG
ncbi:MarR family transcriptional regulator [Nocardia terpenica]|uniref:MarR family winged helix-turn-helix transcriptional regulator n=1 Tax=Nocardia terpenica TaxID=455432 RepID=UPI00189346DD|nr:MarR family transcriptional regulator [Nocardia terpenica]MBF6064449.1 MarR family transcriptional regulator [Nocardia terpenica]MBF6106927.1 MarR family transcriptional regulator [Nocardia terpenica]MBF6114417.1 MarR family transcriptional regulator [Nocardia terpenica]MBF6121497.1 MarR family transcriptional regulator [Nocardia terpenica]MBF6153912.1 MarR family transcriptional regulator [Nocardia terpenica]